MGALKMTKEDTMKILWGDNYYNKKKKKLTTKSWLELKQTLKYVTNRKGDREKLDINQIT